MVVGIHDHRKWDRAIGMNGTEERKDCIWENALTDSGGIPGWWILGGILSTARVGVLALAILTTLLLGTGCAVNTHYDPSLPHHTPEGFRNAPSTPPHEGFWRWKWESTWEGLPKPPANGYNFPVLPVDIPFLAGNREAITLTWIGHATLLLQLGGVNVLVDPIFSRRASPFSFLGPERKVPPAMTLADLPHIDMVLISHNHYDHLDLPSVRALAAQQGGAPRYFLPLGLKTWFEKEVFDGKPTPDVVEQDWWDHSDYLGLRIHQVPAQHFSARTPWDTNEALWGGFVVEHPSFRFYWAGDSGYGPHFKEIGRRFAPIDLAALPIGSYEPRWFMKDMHINPAEAVLAHKDLGATHTVAAHWGTFEMTDESMDEPPRALARALSEHQISPETFFVMQHGETRVLHPATGQPIVRRNGHDPAEEGQVSPASGTN